MEIRNTQFASAIVLGMAIGIGLLGCGFFIAKAVYKAKAVDRFVTVKGIAERDVKADLGIWEIDYREVGPNLANVDTQSQHDQQLVVDFLEKNGFAPSEIELRPTKVNDLLADPYNQQSNNPQAISRRYIVTGGVRVRSAQVDLIQKVNQMSSSLLQQGIALSFNDVTDLNPNPSYYFTQLDAIRPSMLADSTHSARVIADQFALDSNSHLGGIRHASQGVFQIMGRDSSTQSSNWSDNQSALGTINKKIRLVTTLDYYLLR